jgi:hypothetical protein
MFPIRFQHCLQLQQPPAISPLILHEKHTFPERSGMSAAVHPGFPGNISLTNVAKVFMMIVDASGFVSEFSLDGVRLGW